jgi:3-phenylpropionate/trans-cinnamate dioxygenase ferredoxin reductase subunit
VSDTPTVAIVGASLAGGRAAETLRAEGYEGRILLIGEEPYRPYERPPLSKEVLRGEWPAEKVFLRPAEWYAENDVELMLGTRATMIDLGERMIMAGGALVPFTLCLLATGGRPRRLGIPGVELGVLMLRTMDDAAAIGARLQPGARVVIVGAGFIGAEVASTAAHLGCSVTLLEAAPVPLGRALGPELGAIYAEIIRENGVDLRTGVAIDRFEGSGRAERVVLADGTTFEADVVIVGVGIDPNDELALEAGLEVNNGIVVDEHCRTAVPFVYAAGDVANHPNPILGERIRVEHWQNAQNQGAAAARAMIGRDEPFAEVPWFWSDQFGHNLQMAGHPFRWDRIVTRGAPASRSFTAFYVLDDRIVAAFGVDRGKDVRASRALISSRASIPDDVLADESTDLRALAKK